MAIDNQNTNPKLLRAELKRYRAALDVANAEIERRNRNTIILTTFSYRANRAENLDNLFKLTILQALENTGAPVGAVVLIDTETGHLDLGFRKGVTQELTDILTGQTFENSATTLMPHLVSGSGALLEYNTTDDPAEKRLLDAGQITSLASFPLMISKTLVGALLVGLQSHHAFKSSELSFLVALSQATAIAIEGLQLRERLWRMAEVLLNRDEASLADLELAPSNLHPPPSLTNQDKLFAVADPQFSQSAEPPTASHELRQQNIDLQIIIALSELVNRSLDMDEILQCAVDQTRVILETDAAWLYITEGQELRLQAHVGLSKNYVHGMRRLKADESIEGKVFSSNQASFIASLDHHTRKIWLDKENLQSLAAIPITRRYTAEQDASLGWEVLGVLATGKRGSQPYKWSIQDMDLLAAIANQVALAVDKAQSYEAIQQKEMSLQGSNDILREVNDMLIQTNETFEKFVEQDLQPSLTKASELLTQINFDRLTATEQKHLAAVQEIIQHVKKSSHITLNS